MGKNIGSSITRKIGGRYSQKLMGHAELSATDALRSKGPDHRTLQRQFQVRDNKPSGSKRP